MQALKRCARSTWAFWIMEKPDSLCEDLERFNPLSTQITREFCEKYQKQLNSFIDGVDAHYSEKTFRRFVSFYLKRVEELCKASKYESMLRRQAFFRCDRKHEGESKQ